MELAKKVSKQKTLMNNYKVLPFSQYVLRTPLFPLSFYRKLLENYSQETLLQHLKTLMLEKPFVWLRQNFLRL